MNAERNSWKPLAFLSLLAAAMGVAYLSQTDPSAGVIPSDALVEAHGKVAWVQSHRFGTRFGVVGVTEKFDYSSKAKGMAIVRDALDHADSSIVSIQYAKQTNGPLFSDDRFHPVWSISIDGRSVRTYEETASAWRSDNSLSPWLGLALLGCGLYLGYMSWRVRRWTQLGVQAGRP